jgi:hypothetical protein
MAATRRRVGFIGVVVAGLLVLGTACSSSSKSSSSTTTISVSAACSQINSIQSSMNSMGSKFSGATITSAQFAQVQKDLASLATQIEDFASNAPSAIASQTQAVATGFTSFSNAISAVDANNLAQPAVQAQVTSAVDAFNNNAALQQANDAVTAWTNQNCGGTSGTTVATGTN